MRDQKEVQVYEMVYSKENKKPNLNEVLAMDNNSISDKTLSHIAASQPTAEIQPLSQTDSEMLQSEKMPAFSFKTEPVRHDDYDESLMPADIIKVFDEITHF